MDTQIPLPPTQADLETKAPSNSIRTPFIVVSVILFAALTGVIGYIIGLQSASKVVINEPVTETQQENKPAPSATTQSKVSAASVNLPIPAFSTFLATNCVLSNENYMLERNKVPVTSDIYLGTNTNIKTEFNCNGQIGIDKGWLELFQGVYMYGPNSEELGHGGANFLGTFGVLLRTKENVQTFLYADPPHACGLTTEQLNITARVVKTMYAADLSPVYVSSTQRVDIAEFPNKPDTRAAALFKDDLNVTNKECGGPIIDLEYKEINERLVTFVNGLPANDPIRYAIDRLEEEVSSVQPKK